MRWLELNQHVLALPGVFPLLQHLAAQSIAPAPSQGMPATTALVVPLERVCGEFHRHFRNSLKMPRGGVNQGGSMQSGFEMPMVDLATATHMFGSWPLATHQDSGMCWELSTMPRCSQHLAF